MIYYEKRIDLFRVNTEYTLVQCLSTDCNKNEGIVVQFDKKFRGMMGYLYKSSPKVTECLLYQKNDNSQKVLNLFTKKRYSAKPTYSTFHKSLISMREICIRENIRLVAMPKIGSGKDGLIWAENRRIIQEVFKDTDITILVCLQ